MDLHLLNTFTEGNLKKSFRTQVGGGGGEKERTEKEK